MTCCPTRGCRVEEGVLPRVATKQSTRIATIVPASRVRYLAEISDTVRGYHEATERYAAAASRVQRLESVRGELAAAAAADDVGSAESAVEAVEALLDEARTDLPARRRRCPRRVAFGRRVLLRRRAGRPHPRQGDPQRPDAGVVVGQQDPSCLAAPLSRPRRARQLPAPREPPGLLPLHRRRLPVQARGRGPRSHVRGGGGPVPHQPPVQAALRGPARHSPVDGVRLRDALRPRPRPAPRRLRQGRHVRRLRRDARRHEGALRRLRPRVARRRPSP